MASTAARNASSSSCSTTPLTISTQPRREALNGTLVLNDVPLGSHTMVVFAPGYVTKTERIYLTGNRDYIVNLERQEATLTLRLTPANATVEIDGISKRPDVDGILSVKLKTGPHALLVNGGEK